MDEMIRCRVVACRERRADDQSWSFYLINDSVAALDLAVLYEVGSEWGDFGQMQAVDVRVCDLAPGACALLWRDDGELRMELALLVQMQSHVARLRFEFPRLYRQVDLPLLAGLDKPGYEGVLLRSQDARPEAACVRLRNDC